MAENQVKYLIKQVRSPIGHPANQREVLRTLGLRRIGMSVERPDNAAVRGSIRAVNHLVVVEVLGAEKPQMTKKKVTATDTEKSVEATPPVAEEKAVEAAPPVAEESATKTAKKTTKKAAKKTTAAKKTAKKTTKKTAKKASKASGGSS